MELDPAALAARDRYKLMIGCIVPRPIALVSTLSPDGATANVAPFSFFAGVGADPMTLLFCPASNPDGSDKDTLRNARPRDEGGAGEFVVNVAVAAYERKVAASAEPLPPGESEFDLAGFTRAPSRVVAAPRVAESPVAFECRTDMVVRTNPGAPSGGNIVIGRVVHVFVRDDLVDERLHVDPDRLAAIGRMGGRGYCRTTDRFEMPLGRAALEEP